MYSWGGGKTGFVDRKTREMGGCLVKKSDGRWVIDLQND